jgi:hypothetical protein
MIMDLNRRLVLIGAVAALSLALTPGSALARGDGHDGHADSHHRHGVLLKSGLVGSSPDGATIFDATPGGAPWVLDEGTERVRRDGRLDLRVKGLVVPTPPATRSPR